MDVNINIQPYLDYTNLNCTPFTNINLSTENSLTTLCLLMSGFHKTNDDHVQDQSRAQTKRFWKLELIVSTKHR